MKVVFWRSDKPLERAIARDFCKGLEAHGVEFEIAKTEDYEAPLDGTDVAVVIGVKGASRAIMEDHKVSGMNTVYIDKGYTRIPDPRSPTGSKYWRVSVNEFQPVEAIATENRPIDRWKEVGRKIARERTEGGRIIFAGSSQKYCDYWRLGDATEYATSVFQRLRKRTQRELVYRPKPSWRNAVPIEGTTFSHAKRKLTDELADAHLLVTHGSNAALDAITAGVPVLALGDACTKPISYTEDNLVIIDNAQLPSYEDRVQLCANVAYWQYTHEEMRLGVAWEHLKNYLHTVEHY